MRTIPSRTAAASSVVIWCILILPTASRAASPKTTSTFYPPRARANAVANAHRCEWARKQVEEARAAARPWTETPDDELWALIFSPQLKRALDVNVDAGCPKCGKGIYGERGSRPYAWIARVSDRPWKVQCPNCRELFPKNDFGAYYRSGISPDDSLYHPERADRKLLFNADHPDPKDPLHTWGVDDGSGWQRFPGGLDKRDWYIGYHVYFGLNGQITAGIRALATAYSLTGEPIYAHKCAILLDRLADVFPGYDGKQDQFFNNVWRRYSEGILGPSYWDGGAWSQRAIDYDMIYDGIGAMPDTLAFLREKARKYKVPRPKESVADIRTNIEERILVETGRHPDRIDMNGTITEMCRAKVDLVLRGQAARDDLVRVHMPAIVPPRHLNNDGSGNERSTGYDGGAFGQYCSLLEQLYAMDPDLMRAVLDGYPKLRAAFDFWADIWCLEKYIPNIGDAGSPGSTSGPRGTAGAYLALFDVTGNPRYARLAVCIAGGKSQELPRNIYADDPERLVQRAIEADKTADDRADPSVVKPDYRLAILRAGKGDAQSALWFFYSPDGGTSSHSHYDAMTIGLFGCGLETVCEQGYPLYTGDWPARGAWTSHTRSHATVVVDGRCQVHCGAARLLGFKERGPLKWVSAEAPCAYPGVSKYRRTLALVEMSPEASFALDVFRVRGGREHTWTLPVFYADRSTAGLRPADHPNLCDGYITKVQAAPATNDWMVDHAVKTAFEGDVAGHLRIHGPASDATVLLGEGETRLGRGAAERLPYLLLRRRTEMAELESTFVVIHEPYRDRPALSERPLVVRASTDQVRAEVTGANGQKYLLTVEDGGVEAVRVNLSTSHH